MQTRFIIFSLVPAGQLLPARQANGKQIFAIRFAIYVQNRKEKIKAASIILSEATYLCTLRIVGLEPTRLAAQEPKSCTSANSVISAYSNLFYL